MRTNLLIRIAAIVLLGAMSALAASAQTTQASGTVSLKQADGTVVPVKDAIVVFYRTDIKGEYKTKTDKSGRYVYAGLPFTGVFTIAVSAPNTQPTFRSSVRVSQVPVTDFTLDPGDGSALTLEQIKAAAVTTGGGSAPADTAAARKAREEYEKKVAALKAENDKAAATNAQLNDILKAGNAAFNAKNYDQAIASYDQGIQADPTQAVFYSNKSIALRARATDKYNAAIKAKDKAGANAARDDFKTATELADKAVTVYREAKAKNAAAGGAATGGAATQNDELTNFLTPRVETYRIALQANTPNIADPATKAFQEYIAVEPDPAKKAKAETSLADALYQSGQTDQAIAAYRTILSANPNNLDAMFGLGIALAANEATASEAREMLKQYVAKAPATDVRKQDASAAVEALNEALKTPAKTPTATPAKTGRRKG